MTVKRRKKQDQQDIQDLVTALAIGFIVMMAYKEKSLTANTFSDIVVAILPTILLIALIFTSILLLTKNRLRISRAEGRGESTGSSLYDWGQALKHDILTYFIPVLILIIPGFFAESSNLTDFFQAVLALVAFLYLKKMYWARFF